MVQAAGIAPARTLPNGQFFYSPLGLFDFQGAGIAEAYLRTDPGSYGGAVAVWDTGLGKTILGIGMAAYLFEDDLIDLVMVVAERNKITDWHEDFERFSALSAHRYYGPNRQKRYARAEPPHVVITTYETGRNELMGRESVAGKRGKGRKVDGPMVDMLDLRHKRVLWIFDEVTKVKGRSSELHQSYDYILRELRRGPCHQRVLGLTATPLERDFEDAYNIGRICCPDLMPTVATFESTFTRGKDQYGKYVFRKDRETVFAQLFQQIILRKRKTDPDVIDQFPKQIEKSIKVELNSDHAALYDAVTQLFDAPEGEIDERSPEQYAADERRLYGALRMTAGHPAAHLHATNGISQAIAETMGADALRAIKSSKLEELIARLRTVVKGQGAQAIVFTFYGNTVLREVRDGLYRAGFRVGEYHGSRSLALNDAAKNDFIQGKTEVLVTSDAGSRGLNFKNAEYVFEYESALTHAKRTQRINRVHRIDSDKPLVTCYTMIAENTIEEGIIDLVLRRNENQDTLLGDEDDGSEFVSAATRRQLLQIGRKRH